jgi:hypothetical protein
MVGGRLYGTEEERLTMLALRLENVGADKAVRLGSAGIWRGAVAALNEMHEDLETEAPVSLLPEAERHALEARSWPGEANCVANRPAPERGQELCRIARSEQTAPQSHTTYWRPLWKARDRSDNAPPSGRRSRSLPARISRFPP